MVIIRGAGAVRGRVIDRGNHFNSMVGHSSSNYKYKQPLMTKNYIWIVFVCYACMCGAGVAKGYFWKWQNLSEKNQTVLSVWKYSLNNEIGNIGLVF